MTATAIKAGRGKCPHCDERVTYRVSSGGKLRYSCGGCDTSGYAEPGGDGFKAWKALIDQPAGDPTPEPTPAKKSDPAPARGGFSLDQLGA